MCIPIPLALATQIVFNTAWEQYRCTITYTFLGGAVTETPNLSAEIDWRICAGWISLRRYTRELYDHPKASLLYLKARMAKSEVVEDLPYGCVTSTPSLGSLQ